MLCKGCKTMYDFTKSKTIQSFEKSITNRIMTMDLANYKQEQLRKKREFTSSARPRNLSVKNKVPKVVY